MDSTDRKIRDLYKDIESSNVPPHLSWDSMEAGIREKMPTEKRRRRPIGWWWFTGAVLGVIAVWALLFASTYRKSNTEIAGPLNPLVPTATQVEQSSSTTLAQSIATQPKTNTDGDKAIVRSSRSIKEANNIPLHNPPTYADIEGQLAPQYWDSDPTNRLEAEASVSKNEAATSLPVITSVVDGAHKSALSTLAPLPTTIATLGSNEVAHQLSPEQDIAIVNEEIKAGTWLSLMGGTNIWTTRSKPLPAATVSNLPGASASASLMVPLSGQWLLNGSVTAQTYIERLQHSSTDQIQEYVPVTYVAYNSLSNRVSNVSNQDSLVAKKRDRKLDYYNVHSTVGLQLGVAYHISLSNRWSVLPSLQMGVDRLVYQAGVNIDTDGEYVPFSNTAPMYTDYRAAIIPSLQIAYHLGPKWSVIGGVAGRVSLTDWLSGGGTHSPMTATLQGGVAYRW